jgi:hypothetical protein
MPINYNKNIRQNHFLKGINGLNMKYFVQDRTVINNLLLLNYSRPKKYPPLNPCLTARQVLLGGDFGTAFLRKLID